MIRNKLNRGKQDKGVYLLRKLLVLTLCILSLILGGSTAFADEAAVQELTLQQAVSKALANSRSLRVSEYQIQLAQEDRDSAAEAVDFIPTGQTTPEAEKAFNNLVQKDLSLQAAKKDYQAAQDSVVISVYQAYYGVLEAEAALEAAQQAVDQAELQYRGTALKYQFGAASKLQLMQDNDSYESARQAYATAEKTLADSYEKLNQLVGLQPADRPVLTDQPGFSPLEIDSLEAEIARVLEKSPTVWKAQKAVDQAKIALDIYSYGPAETHTYEGMEISISIAEENARAAEESAAQSLRSLYSNIRQLEESHAGLERKLATAEENLRMTELKYQYGRASRIDLIAARSTVAQSKQALLEAECQHAILVTAFKTPWAYGG